MNLQDYNLSQVNPSFATAVKSVLQGLFDFITMTQNHMTPIGISWFDMFTAIMILNILYIFFISLVKGDGWQGSKDNEGDDLKKRGDD